MKKIILLFIISIALFSCKEANKNAKVKCYKVHNSASSDPNAFLYYYLLFNNNGGYYYYSSTTYYTTLPADATWSSSSVSPIQEDIISQVSQSEPMSEIQEPLTELPNEIEVDMSNQTNDATTDNSSSESSTDASSESSSDAGSSDSGGGDSGGSGSE